MGCHAGAGAARAALAFARAVRSATALPVALAAAFPAALAVALAAPLAVAGGGGAARVASQALAVRALPGPASAVRALQGQTLAVRALRGPAFAAIFTESGREAAGARAYWKPARFARARPWLAPTGRARGARHARRVPSVTRVGALFSHDVRGDHFCTAGVVRSPSRDMIITAARCVHGGRGATYRSDIVFVPGYRDRAAPFGVWLPATMIVARGWARSSDPALDVAFIVLRPLAGEHVEDVLGADRLGIDQGFRNVVRVTGYPRGGLEPLTCVNRTNRESRYQMRFACKGYSPGTSGSPWLAHFDARTRTGLIIGVIGGHQRGGDTADVSYSPYFGNRIERLYKVAVRQS